MPTSPRGNRNGKSCPLDGGEVLWNLLYNVSVTQKKSLSQPAAASSAQGTPFGCPKGEPSNTNLQTPYEIKSPTCTKKTPEYQHYRYRQGQQPALASPRRTARYERIPPDGFDTAALEIMQRTLPLGQVCGAMWASPPTHSKRFI